MKIGDKVSFLNEVGGGTIAGFQGKNIVLVEDEDGFQIPVKMSEVVVSQSIDYNTSNIVQGKLSKTGKRPANAFDDTGGRSVSAMLRDGQDEEVDMSVEDMVDDSKEVTFRAKPQEREGGDRLSAYLAFVPIGDREALNPRYELYFVNDSNYTMRFVFSVADGEQWTLKAEGEIEPNTKTFVEELTREEAAQLGRVAVQLMAYKRDGTFEIKPTVDTILRIDAVKFHKLNTFRANPFFDERSLLYTIVENDKTEHPRDINAEELKLGMFKDAASEKTVEEPLSNYDRTRLVGRYADNQRKGNKKNSPYMHHHGLDDAVVVDLHAGQILDSIEGMKRGEILEYQLKVFRETLDKLASKKGQKVVFIHGKGEGVLRNALIKELKYKYKSYTYQDASFQEYGYGATMVVIR
ncbi:MAG: DUF2027 domain-containing protein [Prevotella sp.]|jgi:hypothetical protein